MAEPTQVSKPPAIGRILARGDVICILLFTLLGQQMHGTLAGLAAAWSGFLENSLPILLVWFLLAPFLRTYTRPGWRNLLYTWAMAVTAGVWLRFMVLGKPFGASFFIFLGVTLGVSLLLLLIWRGLARLLYRRMLASL